MAEWHLKARFTRELIKLNNVACRLKLTGDTLTRMISYHGGVEAVKRLLRPAPRGVIHDGLINLWKGNRMDLSTEELATQEEFRPLFTKAELAEAERRLAVFNNRNEAA